MFWLSFFEKMFLSSLHHVFVNWIWSRSFPTLASDTRSLLIQANYFLSAVFFSIFDCTFKPLFVVHLHFFPFTVSCRIYFLVHFGTFSSLLSNVCTFFVQTFEFPFSVIYLALFLLYNSTLVTGLWSEWWRTTTVLYIWYFCSELYYVFLSYFYGAYFFCSFYNVLCNDLRGTTDDS